MHLPAIPHGPQQALQPIQNLRLVVDEKNLFHGSHQAGIEMTKAAPSLTVSQSSWSAPETSWSAPEISISHIPYTVH